MPMLRFDIVEGRSAAEIRALLDATHRAVVTAFAVPKRDRYQFVHEHPASHFIAEDTGLGIVRTRNCVILQITTRPRTREEKQRFYSLLCDELEAACGIAPSDVVVSMVTNSDEDWSFGNGRAQFLTGELSSEATVS
ncbi:MAG TPA: tautomerase family protein [Alphaproteobacteria bacterium]|nr:tautomerase family protein [Alphaproteobacteria bacterium]